MLIRQTTTLLDESAVIEMESPVTKHLKQYV